MERDYIPSNHRCKKKQGSCARGITEPRRPVPPVSFRSYPTDTPRNEFGGSVPNRLSAPFISSPETYARTAAPTPAGKRRDLSTKFYRTLASWPTCHGVRRRATKCEVLPNAAVLPTRLDLKILGVPVGAAPSALDESSVRHVALLRLRIPMEPSGMISVTCCRKDPPIRSGFLQLACG
jgi:hypothetical protein